VGGRRAGDTDGLAVKILVANIGSTSFKFRLFDMTGPAGRELAVGGADRIGHGGGAVKLTVRGGDDEQADHAFDGYGDAIEYYLERLAVLGVLADVSDVAAVAFKTVMGGQSDPVVTVDDSVLERMTFFAPVAPAHNPPYIEAMRQFRRRLPDTPLVAAFEPGFHQTNPQRRRIYAVPWRWTSEYGIRRYGFHGASHRYIATRSRELVGADACRRLISCHLGGSSSICAIGGGASQAVSMGLSPQSGLPQSNRAGDLDVFALSLMHARSGEDYDALLEQLGTAGGLEAVGDVPGGDMRDIRAAADAGSDRAHLAIEHFVTTVCDYLGAYIVELGGLDMLAFTGGIGVNDAPLRERVCAKLGFMGVALDTAANAAADPGTGTRISVDTSTAEVWAIPTNEELIVARLARQHLAGR
jgi:acetate kinase